MALSASEQKALYNRVMGGIPGQAARSTQRVLDDGDGSSLRKAIEAIPASRPRAEFITFTHQKLLGLANIAQGTYRLTADRDQFNRWLLPATRGGWIVRSWKDLGSTGTEVDDLSVFGTDITPTKEN